MISGRTFRTYYRLTKPGIIYGNALAALAGYMLAAQGDISIMTLLGMLTGTSLVIGSACVFNNYIDRNIDAKMARTKLRALASGAVSHVHALAYAGALGILGFSLLAAYTNYLTVAVGALGMFFYIVVYGIAKRKTVHGTLVGAISGALPPVGGYLAASGTIDLGAVLVFVILFIWQMPHFYSIAIFRLNDYRAANIPVLPAVKGVRRTKLEIVLYVALFVTATWLLFIFGYTGAVYLIVMTVISLRWLQLVIGSFQSHDSEARARQSFKFSLLVLLVFCATLSLEHVLP